VVVNIILWTGLFAWLVTWIITFLYVLSSKKIVGKFNYGLIDLVGILSLIGLVIRYW